ncbi:hypothetical protein MPER_00567 [Moniliophthora perniciosa FA553]|nr:hypothetical protein MPER_00567 [Moniliophthora perniciosa FA553]
MTDFINRFSAQNMDFMRPDGEKYVALSSDVDRSLADVNATDDFSKLPLDDQQLLSFDATCILEEEKAETTRKPVHSIFLDIGNKQVPKRSAVRVFTDPSSDIMGWQEP